MEHMESKMQDQMDGWDAQIKEVWDAVLRVEESLPGAPAMLGGENWCEVRESDLRILIDAAKEAVK